MRIRTCLIFLCIPLLAFSQEKENMPGKKITANCSFSLNSNGIASIPAFSLGEPAVIASVNFMKGRFSYDPTLAYNLEMKPWFIDNWFHYKIINKPKFELKAGVNFSSFFTGLRINDEMILKTERYFALSLTPSYRLSDFSSLTFDYWSDNGQEKGTISGHFISLTYDRSEIHLGDKILLSLNMMLFQILYDGDNDGLFFAPSCAFSARRIPVALFFQASQSLKSNIPDLQSFRWNAGIRYNLSSD